MKKISFRVRNFDKEQFLTYNIDNNAELDEELLDYLEEEEPEGIVPVIFEEGEEFDTFSYDITDKIHLCELSDQEINAEMVLMVMRGLVLSMMNMSEYRIPLSYLVLNRKYIYIDSDYKVEFVCVPLEDMKEGTDLNNFFRSFVASLRFDSSENSDYVAKLLTYINDREMFNLRNLLSLIEDLMDGFGIEIPEGESNEIYGEYTEIDDAGADSFDEDAEQDTDISETKEYDNVTTENESTDDTYTDEASVSNEEYDDLSDKAGDVEANSIEYDNEVTSDKESLWNTVKDDDYTGYDEESAVDDSYTESEEEITADEGIAEPEESPADEDYEESEEEITADEGIAEPEDASADEDYEESEEEITADEGIAEPEEVSADEDYEESEEEITADEGIAEPEEVSADEDYEESEEEITTDKGIAEPEEEPVADKGYTESEEKSDSKEDVSGNTVDSENTDSEEAVAEEGEGEENSAAKKTIFKTKDTSSVGVVIEDDLDAFLAEKQKEDRSQFPNEPELKVNKNIKINRASIVKNTQDELKTEEEKVKEAERQDKDAKQKSKKNNKTNKSDKADKEKEKEKEKDTKNKDDKPSGDDDGKESVSTAALISQTLGNAANSLINAASGNGGTKVNPYIIRVNTEERVIIKKQTFKIGKSGVGVDFTIHGNGAISRVHAIITSKNGEYYIKDNKSTNHTFVDGRKVEDGENVLLKFC